MLDWPWPVWALYGVGAAYLLGFAWFFFRFRAAAQMADLGAPDDVAKYNRALLGFPNALYARMMGHRPR